MDVYTIEYHVRFSEYKRSVFGRIHETVSRMLSLEAWTIHEGLHHSTPLPCCSWFSAFDTRQIGHGVLEGEGCPWGVP